MYPVLLSVGKFELYSFGSFIALGALAAGYFLYRASRYQKLPTSNLFDVVLYTLLFGLIGARLGYYLLYQEQFQSFWQILYFWQGGLLAISGLISGFIAYLYYSRRQTTSIWKLLDIGALALLLGWGVGKFGCHLSGCTTGRSVTNFLAVNGSYPIDLFSSIWAIVSVAILAIIWRKQKLSEGATFFLSLEALFLGELLIKTLRADFGENVAKTEAFTYLSLIVGLYVVFWRLHGPKIAKVSVLRSVSSLIGRK